MKGNDLREIDKVSRAGEGVAKCNSMKRSPPVQLSSEATLIVIDLQKAIDHPSWGERNNPQAERNIASLLHAWRSTARPIIHVRHDSVEPESYYRPGQSGNEFKPEAQPLPGELVLAKRTNSAFVGTDLEPLLRSSGRNLLVIAGVITNNSVEATVRMAGNLGFETYLVEDATFTFGRKDWRGTFRTAEEVHAMSLANLDGEYCTVVETNSVLRAANEVPRPADNDKLEKPLTPHKTNI
jgi:nicotinamidase-related amidase